MTSSTMNNIHQVEVYEAITLIEIGVGTPFTLEHGNYPIDAIIHTDGREYLRITRTNKGVAKVYWEALHREGKIQLQVQTSLTYAGLQLPITDRCQIPHSAFRTIACGYIIAGRFVCTKCAEGECKTMPDAIPVYPAHILPYSQDCLKCGVALFRVWKRSNGKPLMLFNLPE